MAPRKFKNEKIARLAIDVYKGKVTDFSLDEAQETLRAALNKLCGSEDGTYDYRKFRKNKYDVFEIIEEVLDVLITEGLTTQYSNLVEYKQVNIGEMVSFRIQDYRLFPVAQVAAGNNDLVRQRIDHQDVQVKTAWFGVAVYDEFDRFLNGETDFGVLVNKINASFQAQIAQQIYNGIVAGYNALAAPYYVTGTYERTSMNTLVQHIKAATGQMSTVFGTLAALQNATPYGIAYNGPAIEERNALGFFRIIDGVTYQEIQQAHVPGTDNFAISDDFLLVIPNQEKIVKFVDEGESRIVDLTTQGYENLDDSLEYSVRKKYGLAVVTSSRWGAYILD